MQLPRVGDLFESRYEILDVIGEGGFARVFRARDGRMARDVALKISNQPDSARATKRFLREAAVIAELQDPHTITLYDFGTTPEGLRYMAFEYLAGRDLRTLLAERGPLTPDATVHILLQLLSALGEAHARGILHRDIKPSNVLVFEYAGDPFRVKLLDFGIAKPTAADAPSLTQTGDVVGTPRYMAPEQVFGEPLSPATDLYSLGLVAYELLVGRRANAGASPLALAASHTPLEVPAAVAPPGLRLVVEKMATRDPAGRYPSAEAVRGALRQYRPEVRGWAGPPREPEPAMPPAPSQPRDPTAVEGRPRAPRVLLIAIGALIPLAALPLLVDDPDAPSPRAPLAPATTGSGTRADIGPSPLDADEPVADPCVRKRPRRSGVQTLTRLHGLTQTSVAAYVPPGYDPSRPHGLVVYYHDMDEDPRQVLQRAGFDNLLDLERFLVVAPRSRSTGVAAWTAAEDSARAQDQVDIAYEELCVDPARVFVIGHGSGARPAYQAMCSPLVAAVATTSHQMRPAEERLCLPETPKPYLHVAATADPWEPLEGGKGCTDTLGRSVTVLSQAEQRQKFRATHRCSGDERRWSEEAPESCVTWDCELPFVSCTAPGGRVWATDTPRPWRACGSKPSEFPHVRTIWQFFSEVVPPP